ncbi:tail protein [Dunaliella viridis virus SI2]|uniref:tail protein n=1 Tax=Dunaliella viridis virus SI2 TaxID=754069 RepID=UPI0002C12DC5|nr:tail protein [Dunaliella viridis virus SI2]AGH15991.1 hypothetical protein DVVG_00005 [Dunaliella viridis virus SI2]
MPLDRYSQQTWASGEFDPLLGSREDVAFYYSSAKVIENAVVLPQAGMKRREGLLARGLQRGLLTAVTISAYTFGAPEGGTAGNVDSTSSGATLLTTGAIGTATEYVVSTIDAGAAVRVSVADIIARLVGGTISTGTLALQSSDDNVTYTTRASLQIGTAFQRRRWAVAPDTDLGTHRYWRIILANPLGSDYGTDEVELYGLSFWQEAGYSQSSAAPGEVLVRKITTSIIDEYFAVISDQNVDIYTDEGVWQAAVFIPHTDADIAEIKTSQNLDTLVLYQEDNPPQIIQRLDGADDQWRSGAFPFATVSQFPFEDSTTGGQNEIQEITFASMTAGDRFVFELNGDISAEVVWSGTPATNVTNITAALEGLEDIADVTVTNPAGTTYEIEFVGDSANRFFPVLIVDILTGSGTAPISRTQYGQPNQEDLWSATRGYPRCGTFYQGSHWMGGFRSRTDILVRSRMGDFADFREDADPVATSPLVLAPDVDEQVEIVNLYPGRNLQIFTSSVEIYIPDEPITPTNVALKVTSKRGHFSRTQPVDVQGGTLYVDRNGTALREYLFAETEQSYTAEPVSTLGGHLVQEPVDMTLRRSRNTDEPTIVYLVNQGRDRDFEKVPAAALTVDRAQQVTAMTRMTTGDGHTFRAVAASQGGQVMAVVERALAGNEWNYVELLDANHMSDHSYEIANPDLETFTASALQTVFTYTFSNPTEEIDIGVFTRADTLDVWRRVEPADYTLDTGAKTITFDTGRPVGTLVAITRRATSFSTGAPELDGVECYVHADGRPVGAHTPASGTVTISGDEGFNFNARIGLRMVPRLVMQAYKGQGDRSPTMEKQRIFRALLSLDRTSNVAICMEGQTPRAIALTRYDSGVFDRELEEVLFTGTKRISGLGKWETEPRLEITQTEPGPWLLRSVSYDIRF